MNDKSLIHAERKSVDIKGKNKNADTKKFRYGIKPISELIMLVREAGVEPAHPKVPDPKSGASANFATRAFVFEYYQ